ncbi:transporter [Hanstruepera marina]|uniref:transporter n=1 Tax=Hanstruepera marina TaxID=2873265 RepID=UPI001CA66F2D|nr:transporter [Hanstruepera marina]
MKSIKTYLLAFVFLSSFYSFSQYTEVINSNRPGVSLSAFSVGTNVVQFEVGPYLLNENHNPLNREDKSYGVDFAVRYGFLFPQLEVSVGGAFQSTKRNYTNIPNSEETYSNFKSLTAGVKYLVYDPYKNSGEEQPNLYSWKANHSFKWRHLIPAISVYAGINYDTSDNPYTAAGVEGISPRVLIASQNNFSSGWVYVMNFMLDRIGTDQQDFSYVLTLTKSIFDQWAVFGEFQGISSDFYADNLIRFGGAYLWTRNFQLDTALTFNTKDTPAVFGITLGASYRLDFHKDKEGKDGTSAEEELERRENKARGKSENKRQKEDTNFDDDGI